MLAVSTTNIINSWNVAYITGGRVEDALFASVQNVYLSC